MVKIIPPETEVYLLYKRKQSDTGENVLVLEKGKIGSVIIKDESVRYSFAKSYSTIVYDDVMTFDSKFVFIEPPSEEMIKEAYQELIKCTS